MALADLTDRGSVLKALREFDCPGRDGFLSKHGFGAARSYFVRGVAQQPLLSCHFVCRRRICTEKAA